MYFKGKNELFKKETRFFSRSGQWYTQGSRMKVELIHLKFFQEFLCSQAVVQVAEAVGQLWNWVVGPRFDLFLTRENVLPKGQAYTQPISGFLNSLQYLK